VSSVTEPYIEPVARVQHQRLQSGRALRPVAVQQTGQQILIERHARRQLTRRPSLRQRIRRTKVHGGHGQHQIARAVTDGIAQGEGAVGGRADRALGQDARLA
jgi:hypothetical protein